MNGWFPAQRGSVRIAMRLVALAAALVCLAFGSPCVGAVPSRAAMCINLETGQVYYAQHQDVAVPPASLTKIMSMFVALDAVRASKVSLTDRVRISRRAAATGGSTMDLRRGERVPLMQLLTGMAVASGNDAAMSVAEHVGGSVAGFVARMNGKARSLGMRNTVFRNPTGLPAAGQQTTARDMATLARAYLRSHPSVRYIHSLPFFRYRGRTFSATNSLLDGGMPGVDGLKTGWTVASGYNIVVTATRGGKRLLAVVLGARSKVRRDEAVRRLLSIGSHGGQKAAVRKKGRK
jgi:D-alanyl-D-alanine carboxypeptidase (penicillin-binding protein 5/6)